MGSPRESIPCWDRSRPRLQLQTAVSTVALSAPYLKIRPGPGEGLLLALKHFSIDAISDGADGADGRARVGFGAIPHPNNACACSPLTTKGNFDTQRSKGRLRASEPAGKRSG